MKSQHKFLLSFLAALIAVLYGFSVFAATTNKCIQCHTNDALMKSMHKPPVLPKSEGEG
ncbi:MAG: hypothetical protein GX874_06835 [Smithella sp.]|nr:hypothetical protein [Smithellaceae bacterium]NLA41111.1 hypothetical protein [Smithella sp.]